MPEDRPVVPPRHAQFGFVYYVRQMLRTFWREPGTFAHAGHRFTGLVVVGYLLAHIWVISNAAFNETRFDELMETFHMPLFLFMEWLVWGAVCFHGLNGVRVIIFDYNIWLERQVFLFWIVMGLTLLLMAVGFYITLWPEVAP